MLLLKCVQQQQQQQQEEKEAVGVALQEGRKVPALSLVLLLLARQVERSQRPCSQGSRALVLLWAGVCVCLCVCVCVRVCVRACVHPNPAGERCWEMQ